MKESINLQINPNPGITSLSTTFQQKLNDMSTSAEITQHPEVKTILEELYEKG